MLSRGVSILFLILVAEASSIDNIEILSLCAVTDFRDFLFDPAMSPEVLRGDDEECQNAGDEDNNGHVVHF